MGHVIDLKGASETVPVEGDEPGSGTADIEDIPSDNEEG